MIKRLLTGLLALVLFTTLLPIYTLATDGSIDPLNPLTVTEDIKLFARLFGSDTSIKTQLTIAVNDWIPCNFYYGTETENIKLRRDALTFSDGLNVIGFNDDFECIFNPTRPGNHTVSYTDSSTGTSHTFSVDVPLPNYGFYSSSERNADTYLSVLSSPMGQESTFYLNWNSSFATPETVTIGETVYIPTVDDKNNCSMAIPLTLAEGSGQISAQINFASESPYFLNIPTVGTNNTVRLFAANIMNGLPLKQVSVPLDLPNMFYLCFGNDTNYKKLIHTDKPSVSGSINLVPSPHVNGEIVNDVWTIEPTAMGTGTITYNDGDKQYSLSVQVTLPEYGMYTSTTVSEATLATVYEHAYGETVELYLLYPDDPELPDPTRVTMSTMDPDSTSTDCTITPVTQDVEAGYKCLKVTFASPGKHISILYYVENKLWGQSILDYIGGEAAMNSVRIPYQDTTITVGAGYIENDAMILFPGTVQYYDEGTTTAFSFPIVLCALDKYGTNQQQLAPKEFYERISNVRVDIVSCINEDASATPYVSASTPAKLDHQGITTWQTNASADAGKGFMSTLKLTFTYTNDSNQTRDYEIPVGITYKKKSHVALDAASLYPADKLSETLSSYESLLDWFEKTYPNDFMSFGGGTITLKLPAKHYDKPITVNVDNAFYDGIILTGSEDNGIRTTLPGLVHTSGIVEIRDMNFSSGKSNSPTGTGLTGRSIKAVTSCNFRDLDRGIHSTDSGFIGGITNCTFFNCKTGILLDSGAIGKDNRDNGQFTNNRFVNNSTAVVVMSLPGSLTPYELRIVNNIFLDNQWDFDVPMNGRFYFYKNVYGHDTGNNKHEHRSVRIKHDGNPSTVVTNPCLRLDNGEYLWIDRSEGLFTYIFNDESSNLIIGGESFGRNDPAADIHIMDSNGNDMAVWHFGGNE